MHIAYIHIYIYIYIILEPSSRGVALLRGPIILKRQKLAEGSSSQNTKNIQELSFQGVALLRGLVVLKLQLRTIIQHITTSTVIIIITHIHILLKSWPKTGPKQGKSRGEKAAATTFFLLNKSEQLGLNLSGSWHRGFSQYLQYLDSVRSSANIYIYIYIYVCMCMYVCIYIYIYIYMYHL